MPVINGRYYMNPQYGAALEAARAADGVAHASRSQEQSNKESLVERVLDKISPVAQLPYKSKAPGPPPEFYDDMKVNHLRVREVANIVANENHDVTPGQSTPEELQQAKIAQAHAIINADKRWGNKRDLPGHAETAPSDVTASLEHSVQYAQALDAARTAFQEDLAGHDPIGGRVAFFNRNNASVAPRRYASGVKAPIHSQFGPFRLNNREVYTLVNDDPLNASRSAKKK